MDLLTKAIADAKAVKETALANAKLKLEETFQPTLQRMISSKIQEEEGDEDDDIDIDVNFDSQEDEGSDDIGMGSFENEPEGDDEFADEEESVEEGDETHNDGDPFLEEWEDEEMNEEDEIDLDELFEEDDIEMDSLDEEDEVDLEELFTEEDEEEMYESDDEELNLEGLFREEDEEEEFAPVQSEVRRLRRENRKLRSKVNESLRAVTTYKKAINEVNLLNAKLLYTTNVIKDYDLNNKQKMQVLEAFDNANSVREVKLINKSIVSAFGKKKIVEQKSKGSASKARTVLNPTKQLNENVGTGEIIRWSPSRFQQLAGMKEINY